MRYPTIRTRLLAATACAGMAALAAPAMAQDGDASEGADDENTIVVSGFRQSLENALNNKRNSDTISDFISAEDIGKQADQNIAEAMQRVTGVSIERADGEGTTVTVRGVSGSLNQVTLNGVPVTSSGGDQNVDFSDFSSDLLQSIEIQKTPSASTDEGSLGASIKLKTFRPLDSRRDRRILEVQGRYGDLGDNLDYKVQGALSQKFGDWLGISLVATRETRGTRLDRVNLNRYVDARPQNGATNAETGQIVTEFDYDGDGVFEPLVLRTAQQIRYESQLVQRDRDSVTGTIQLAPWEGGTLLFDATWTEQVIDRDNRFIQDTTDIDNPDPTNVIFDPNTFTVIRNVYTATDGRVSGINRFNRQVTTDEQTTKVYSALFEQQLGDFDFSFQYGHSESESDPTFNLRGFFRLDRPGRDTGFFDGYDCEPDSSGKLDCQLVMTEGLVDDPSQYEFQVFRNDGILSESEADAFYADVQWETLWGPLASLEAGFKWTERSKLNNQSSSACNRGCVGGELNPFTLADFVAGEQSDDDFGRRLGLPRNDITDGFPIFDIQKARDFAEEQGVADQIALSFLPLDEQFVEEEVMAGYLQANYEFFNGRLRGDIGVRYQKTDIRASAAAGFTFSGTQTFITEENLAEFGSAEAIAEALGPLTATTVGTTSATDAIIAEETFSYDNWLPSFNATWLVSDDKLIRFAASKTIARPRFTLLAPTFTINEGNFSEFSNGEIGSTNLLPFKSTNIDLSFEWYFRRNSLLSVAFFNKDFSDFEEQVQFTSYWRDVRGEFFDVSQIVDPTMDRAPQIPADQITFNPSPSNVLIPISQGDASGFVPGCMPNRELDLANPFADDVCDIALLRARRNGQGGYVRGVEVALQHNFDNWPGLLGGLGFTANYTYADSKLDEEELRNPDGTLAAFVPSFPFENTSEHTFNGTIYWERDGNLIRLAYNYRTDYLVDRIGADFNSIWSDDFESLDLSASWKITRSMQLNFQAVNLLDSISRRYATTRPDPNSPLPSESSELGSQPQFRTIRLDNTGRIFRLGLRFNF